ncbi:MAG: sigma-70 family RNA polymerase sigma factor, partial [Cytophagales bacterium]|nr:sigma-70 family RNA polymerase sigma factor [Cytophagales bacterium]
TLFNTLWKEQQTKLANYLAKTVHDKESIKDIMAAAFYEVYVKWDTSSNREALLYAIARNMAYKHVRDLSIAFNNEKLYLAFVSENSDWGLDGEQLTNLVQNALNDMEPVLRPYFYLLLEDKSRPEMEQILQVDQSTVSRNIRKVKDFLIQYAKDNEAI